MIIGETDHSLLVKLSFICHEQKAVYTQAYAITRSVGSKTDEMYITSSAIGFPYSYSVMYTNKHCDKLAIL